MLNDTGIGFKSPWWAAVLSVLLVGLGLYLYYLKLYPVILLPLLAIGAYFVIYYPKQLLIFIVFATPLSWSFENVQALGGVGFYLPTEPLLVALMLMYITQLAAGMRESKELMRHPLTIAIMLYLGWMFITSLTSTMPIVSFKFLLSRLWFILVVYFMMNHFFKDEKYIYKFFKVYIVAMAFVIVYTVYGHAKSGFDEDVAHWIMWPFFKDHTSYGAIIAMMYPMVVYAFYSAKRFSMAQFIGFAIFMIFTVGLILSYTRAAWVSLVGALGVWVLIKLRIDFKVVVLGALVLTGLYFGFEDQIVHEFRSNRQDSSGDLTEHVQSITNVSSDASNLERLNRWNSAIRMFEEKPVFGYGPGTYMFKYALFQKSSDRTIISTNVGDGGNAHSEYLGPLSESGLFGTLTVLGVFIMSIVTGIRLYYKLNHNKYLQGVVMAIVLGMVTYYLHGILNNYLDTDKASVPLWGMMSILVGIQIYHLPKKESLKPAAK